MQSILLHRVAHFIATLHPDKSQRVRASCVPVDNTEARLTVRITATEDALCKAKLQLEDEKSRSKKLERRAAATSADLAVARASSNDLDDFSNHAEELEQQKNELEHRVTRLNRMLTVAEEQRDVAIARLAGFTGGIEGVHEENRILKGTVATLEGEVESVSRSWQDDFDKKETTIQELQNREAVAIEHVRTLKESYDQVALEKCQMEEKLSKAEFELLEREADRCLVSVYAAEKERLIERVEHASRMAWKVPHLESDNQRMEAAVREGKRTLEDMAALIMSVKKKHDKLVVHAREREQYGESMAQMFEDMKKECDRLRGERDEKSRLCETITETHEQMRTKQDNVIESLTEEVEKKAVEATTSVAMAKRLQAECEQKNEELRNYLGSYNRVAALLDIDVISDTDIPDHSALESNLSNIVRRMNYGEARVANLSRELDAMTKENKHIQERANKLLLDNNEANEARSTLEERVLVIQHDNVRLIGRTAEFEAEVRQLKKSGQVFESRMEELIIENDGLQSEVVRATTLSKTLQEESNSLRAQVQSMEASLASEREHLSAQLTERTSAFEKELNNAREEYRLAAENFENRRRSMTRHLNNTEKRKEVAEQGLVQRERIVNDSTRRVNELAERCLKLKEENDGLKESRSLRVLSDDFGDVLVLREMLAESEDAREQLQAKLEELEHSQERRLSSSSVSTDEDVARRVHELEISLEEEAKAKAAQKQRLCEAEKKHEKMKRQLTDLEESTKEKEMEAEKLRGEMASIYSTMRKMACVSLPPGAEELLDDDDDLRRLNELREATRREESGTAAGENRELGREGRKLPPQKRRVRVGGMGNKTRFLV